LVLAEKEDKKSLTNKKISSVNALKALFFAPEAAEVKRAGGNEKIARFHHRVRSSEERNIREEGFDRV